MSGRHIPAHLVRAGSTGESGNEDAAIQAVLARQILSDVWAGESAGAFPHRANDGDRKREGRPLQGD